MSYLASSEWLNSLIPYAKPWNTLPSIAIRQMSPWLLQGSQAYNSCCIKIVINYNYSHNQIWYWHVHEFEAPSKRLALAPNNRVKSEFGYFKNSDISFLNPVDLGLVVFTFRLWQERDTRYFIITLWEGDMGILHNKKLYYRIILYSWTFFNNPFSRLHYSVITIFPKH